jgi:hypothetical protein
MSLFKASKIICILVIFIIIINRIIFFICPNQNINEAYQSFYQRSKDKKIKRAKAAKKNRVKQTDWGIDYHGSVLFDDYYMPQINFKPAYLFFDSDYYTY